MDSLIGFPVDGLLAVVKYVGKKVFFCKKSCERLQKTLEGMEPILKEIFHTGVDQLPEHLQKPLREFFEELNKGKKMVEECSKVHTLNFYEIFKYATKIDDLDLYITGFIQRQGWALTYYEVRHIRVILEGVQNPEHRTEERFYKSIEEPMDLLENGKKASTLHFPDLPKFRVGLDISVHDLKKRLLKKDVRLVGVVGFGGSGKTTLARAICNDIGVQDHFQKRIVFERVGRFPDIMAILDSMWINIVGKDNPHFRNIEDARIQIQEKISSMEPPRPTLVVLDDVWTMDHLDKLMFEGEGYKTLITTRNENIVTYDQRYEKRLLGKSDVARLFYHWAFGQESIPETGNDMLFQEVIAECNGFPPALKVIGSYSI